jgi:hypothetical protein
VTGSNTSAGMPVGLSVDPTDLSLVNGLAVANPNVPLTSWLLYPNVITKARTKMPIRRPTRQRKPPLAGVEETGAEGLEPPTYGFGDRRSTN